MFHIYVILSTYDINNITQYSLNVREPRNSEFSKFVIPMFVISEDRDRFIGPNYSRALIVYCIFTNDISAGSTHMIYELYRKLQFSRSLLARFRSEALKKYCLLSGFEPELACMICG